MFIVDECWSTW